MINEKMKMLCKVFGVEGEYSSYVEITSGNINNTYKMTVDNNGRADEYIVQRVNTNIFKNAVGLMGNVKGVTRHIRKKMVEAGEDPSRMVLEFLESEPDKIYYIDSEDNFWRMYHFVDRSVTYNWTDDPKVLREAGLAFGRFQMQLADYDASTLCETIPNFHNTKVRMDTLFEHVKEDRVGRVAKVLPEIEYVRENYELGAKLTNMLEAGKLPLRVTHNDTKCNNVLFDEKTNNALSVIDLDTIMPGLSVHDFGDAIRFATNTVPEDEKDLSLVGCDLGLFRAFAEGFISQTASALTKEEIDNMALGAFTMTFELVVRFLDDYICGDTYFKIKSPEHNLERTRCQMALAKDMQKKLDKMNEIIASVAAEYTK